MKNKLFIGIFVLLFILPIGFSALIDSPNIVAYWNFNGNANDYFGNYNGTVSGVTQSTTYPTFNISGNGSTHSYSFDGTNNYISIPDSADFDFGTGDWSTSFWIKTSQINSYPTIISRKHTGTANEWAIFLEAGKIFYYSKIGATTTSDTISNSVVNNNVWNFVTITQESSVVKCYINGVLDKTSSVSFTNNIVSSQEIWIGWDNANAKFNGYIDEPSIFNKALSLTEIQEIYNYGLFKSEPTTPNFTITVKNEFNNESITTFNATINNITYSTTNGTLTTGILANSTSLYNITIFAEYYLERIYTDVNVSSNLIAYLKQSVTNFYATDILTNLSLTNFNVTINGTTKLDSEEWYLPFGNYTAVYTKSGHSSNNISFEINSADYYNYTISLTPQLNVSILKEITNTKFNTNETQSTSVSFICDDQTQTFSFNKTSNANSLTAEVTCKWQLIKLDVVYSGSSYYRTLIPEYSNRNIVFYAIDSTIDTTATINLIINDLTGEYNNGYVIIRKFIGTENKNMIEQFFDVTNRAILHLVQGQLYTISIRSASGTKERSLGYLLADSTGERTITIPNINFVPDDVYLGSKIQYTLDKTETSLRLIYNDSSLLTTNLTFSVYNASDYSTTIYETTSYDLGFATFNYVYNENQSYRVCFEANHQELNEPIKVCKLFVSPNAVGELIGFGSADSINIKFWFSIIFVLIMLITLSRVPSVALAVSTFSLWIFNVWKWFSFGNATMDYTVLSILTLITIFEFYRLGVKK
jgi:hypothetical protein